jgi:glycosyltransferase involved in cell wall biosynthesis
MHKTLLQINSVCNSGSTGKIAEGIGKLAVERGWDSYIAWGRKFNLSGSKTFKIDTELEIRFHGLKSRLFDGEGTGSVMATKRLLNRMDEIKPTVVQIHNLHGYYINYPLLMQYLIEKRIPTFLTLHDCWVFTGHCAHFASIGCEKWKTGCRACPSIKDYPESWFVDNSTRNWKLKNKFIGGCENLSLIPVCDWMNNLLSQSFLRDKRIITLHNGVNVDLFQPTSLSEEKANKYGIARNKHILLAVSNFWNEAKGLNDMFELRKKLDNSYQIVIVGHHDGVNMPEGIIGISHTENQEELRDLYSDADVFINPTHADTFPTTNLEAMACGTPVVTYDTGGCSESVGFTGEYGEVVRANKPEQMAEAIKVVIKNGKKHYSTACREKVEIDFNENKQFQKYIDLYEDTLKDFNVK